jgi:lipoprotein-anchoring transpeptidase ErfK/SrfK
MRTLFAFLVPAALSLSLAVASPTRELAAVTFAEEPGAVYVSVREACDVLAWPMDYDPVTEILRVRGRVFDLDAPRLSDGTWLVSLTRLAELGAPVSGNRIGDAAVAVAGPKRVLIDLGEQRLVAWQGSRVVLDTKISSGREGKETPPGNYRAGFKKPMHISSIYGSEMPWSIHLAGNIFIHGSDRFHAGPGSAGCIRMPMHGRRNWAEFLYRWIDTGTPVRVHGRWSGG